MFVEHPPPLPYKCQASLFSEIPRYVLPETWAALAGGMTKDNPENSRDTTVAVREAQEEMETLEVRLGQVSKYLGEIRDETEKEIVCLNLKLASDELEGIRTILLETVEGEVSERQMEVIGGRGTGKQVDPSIQYFGAEWSSVFSKLFNTGLNIRIFKQRQSAGYLDILSLASILAEMDKVQEEVELHMMFINPKYLMQPGAAQHKRENVKYRKAKTENLNGKCSAARQEKVKETSTPKSGRRKRKSVVETITNIFNLKIK